MVDDNMASDNRLTDDEFFEEIIIQNTTSEAHSVIQGITDYLHNLQHLVGAWSLDLRRLRLEVDGESEEINGLFQSTITCKFPRPHEKLSAFTGTVWSDDAPLMKLIRKMKSAKKIRLLIDYYIVTDFTLNYGANWWCEYFTAHDTPALRQVVRYRCIAYDETITEYYAWNYGPGDMEIVPFTAKEKELPPVDVWTARQFCIFAPSPREYDMDKQALAQVKRSALFFDKRYMKGLGNWGVSDNGFFLSGPVTVRADEMETLFQDAEAIRQHLAPYAEYAEIDATFLPDRKSGNEVFALVHVYKQETLQIKSVLL